MILWSICQEQESGMKRTVLWLILMSSLAACNESAKTDDVPARLPFEVNSKVETAIDLKSLYYNSRDIQSKSPYGAVVQGENVTLNFRARKNDLIKARAILTRQEMVGNSTMEKYTKYKTLEMKKTEGTNGLDIWTVQFSIKEIGVYGYHFELYKNEEDAIVYADNDTQVKVPWVNIKGTGGFGKVTPLKKFKLPYTLTVYTNDYHQPQWSENMIIYYIFPERFKNGNRKNDPSPGNTLFYGKKAVEKHTPWSDPLPWVPGKSDNCETDDKEYCNDFYGGDLDGVIQKLDYIASLGVNVIYLNPIFFAPSNHKYDTADYKRIDPMFGDLDVFKKLIAEAKKRGIHIILDASLNHSGSDSVYMDRYGKYPGIGAFENETIRTDSPYYDWYEFNPKATTADQMYNQWANPTLANLKESESYKDFAYRNKDSISQYWLGLGAGGWRMDVTPWVSDQFWKEWRASIKKNYPDIMTFSEVWFDASKYLVGDMFDTTMNYIFRQAVLDFARGGNAIKSMDALEMIRENYPKPAFDRAMNLLSSHDLPRVLWEVGYKSYGQDAYGEFRKRMLLAVAFQFCYPGAPTIYYGDEIGLTGGHDPFNRGPYPWKEDGGDYGDETLLQDFKKLSSLRTSEDTLKKGSLEPLYTDKNVIIIRRNWNDQEVILLFNNAKSAVSLDNRYLDKGTYMELFNSRPYTAGDSLELGALSFMILKK